MEFEIISVHPDRLDQHTFVIEVWQIPGFWGRLRGQQKRILTYKGQKGAWYVPPSFRPAPAVAVQFLDKIASAPEYAHLRTFRKTSH